MLSAISALVYRDECARLGSRGIVWSKGAGVCFEEWRQLSISAEADL